MPKGRSLENLAKAEQGIQRVYRGASAAPGATFSLPDLSGQGGAAATNAGSLPIHGNILAWYQANQPGILIGQDPSPRDRSIRLYRWADFTTSFHATTIPASGNPGIHLPVDTVKSDATAGFVTGGATAIYAPGSAQQASFTYSDIAQAAWPSTPAYLIGAVSTGAAISVAADKYIIPSGTRPQYDPYITVPTIDMSGKSFVVESVVRVADPVQRGIGRYGTGDESGTGRSLCVFGAVASGAGSSPGAGQAIYVLIDPNGSVRAGWDATHEVATAAGTVVIGRAYNIILQYDQASGNTTLSVGGRGGTDVVTATANIGAPASIGTTPTVAWGNVTLANTLYSFSGYWGFGAIYFPTTAWNKSKFRSHWIEAGLDTQNRFGGALPYGATMGAADCFPTRKQSKDMDVARTNLTSKPWLTHSEYAREDFIGYMANSANVTGYNSIEASNAIYIVDETVPEVGATGHPDQNQPDMIMGLQQGVPIPDYVLPALTTDASFVIWRPSTDEYWEVWSSTSPAYNVAPTTAANIMSRENNRWNTGYFAWATDFSHFRGRHDQGFGGFQGNGWGASATKIPYGFGAARIQELIDGELKNALACSGCNSQTPPTSTLVSSSGGGVSGAGIQTGATFTGLSTDTITVASTAGWPGKGRLYNYAGAGSLNTINIGVTIGGMVFRYTDMDHNTLKGVSLFSGSIAATAAGVTATPSSPAGGSGNGGTHWPALFSDQVLLEGIWEGSTWRIPRDVDLDQDLPAFTSPNGSWVRPTTLTDFEKILVKAIQRHGLNMRDKTGGFVVYLEDPWDYLRKHGYNPYKGQTIAVQVQGTPSGTEIPVASISTLNDHTYTPSMGGNTPIATPISGGGSLSAGTYFYKVTVLTTATSGFAAGESTASLEASATVGASGRVHLSWPWRTGATNGYRVYRGTSAGGENTYFDVPLGTTTFIDTGAAGTAGTPPGASTAHAAGYSGNVGSSKAWSPQRQKAYMYMGIRTSTTPPALIGVHGDVTALQDGDWLVVDNNGPMTDFNLTDAAFQALYPGEYPFPAGVPIWPGAHTAPSVRNLPFDLLETVDDQQHKNGPSTYTVTNTANAAIMHAERFVIDKSVRHIAATYSGRLNVRVQNVGSNVAYVGTTGEFAITEGRTLRPGAEVLYTANKTDLYAQSPLGTELRVAEVG